MTEIDDPLDEAFAAYLRACDDGREEDREAFIQRYPAMADRLRELMSLADSLGSFVASHDRSAAQPEDSQPGVIPDAKVSADAETVDFDAASGQPGDRNLTLPLGHREAGDSGPTLPFGLGDYQLQQVIGRGGMGVVYLAVQKNLDRKVAVKMIRSGALASEAEVARFYTEARAAAALEHRNIVSVFQFGHMAGHHFFSMELVPGTDMAKRIKERCLAPHEAARYVRDVARAIHHAHQRGVLHRDLKPANVLIDLEDQVRITDFGLAKHIDSDSSVTGSGAAIGTPSYMAPEQASGHSDRAGRASDIYSLGAILFAAIAGRPPFQNESTVQTLLQVVHQSPPSLSSLCGEVPEDIETIVDKCLQKSPSKRYATANELADDLDAFLDGRPIQARPHSCWTRIWHWLHRVPLIAALAGKRVIDSTEGHRRFQTAMLALALLTPLLAAGMFAAMEANRQRMPSVVELAGGLDGGMYDSLSKTLGERLMTSTGAKAMVVNSDGSIDNHQQLIDGSVDLAPMQAIAMTSSDVCVVAPLFYEAVHVLVRSESALRSAEEIKGHRVAVGLEGSGSRLAAEMVLESLGHLPGTTPRVAIAWPDLAPDERRDTKSLPDVAVVCIHKGSRLAADMLNSAQWRLLPLPAAIDISLQHPSLRPMTIAASDYPQAGLPPEGVATVGMTAFLAARSSAPDALITAALQALYQPPPIAAGLIPRRQVSEWQGLDFHRAARKFFERNH
ncbi:MAG: serine/threonine-protein kinase [Planctomycetaceae bacterium]